ncbi:hypothetical protein SLA2020_416190 [Shorea laevis]
MLLFFIFWSSLDHRQRRIQFLDADAGANGFILFGGSRTGVGGRRGGEKPLELQILDIVVAVVVVVKLRSGNSSNLVVPLDLASATDPGGERVMDVDG